MKKEEGEKDYLADEENRKRHRFSREANVFLTDFFNPATVKLTESKYSTGMSKYGPFQLT